MPQPQALAATRIKCIVVHLPYWEEIMLGEKTIEYRTWTTSYRGPLAIAAAKRKEAGDRAGCAVCTIELVDIRKGSGNEFEWILEDPRPIWPVPIKGRLGIFDIDIPLDYDVHITVEAERAEEE